MVNEEPSIENENSDEGEPLSPEEEMASLRKERQKIIEEVTPERLGDKETEKKIKDDLANIDQRIEEIHKEAGIGAKDGKISFEPTT